MVLDPNCRFCKMGVMSQKEKAVAQVIFNLYERTFFKHKHAIDNRDKQRADFLEMVLNYLCSELLKNPRLLYFWDERGGGMHRFYEDEVVDHYAGCMSDVDFENIADPKGPFYVQARVDDKMDDQASRRDDLGAARDTLGTGTS